MKVISPLLILVSGAPCSGKTRLSREIAAHLNFSVISRDEIKELLFDTLGWSDRAWSKKVGAASFSLMYKQIELLMAAKTSFIVETNFHADSSLDQFNKLIVDFQYRVFHIKLSTHGAILLRRFETRATSGERHPGHVDDGNLEEFRNVFLSDGYRHPELGGKSIDLDTSNFGAINLDQVLREIPGDQASKSSSK